MSHHTPYGTFLCWDKLWERTWVDTLIHEDRVEIYFYNTQDCWILNWYPYST